MARPHFLAPMLRTTEGELALFADGIAQPIATRLSGAFDSTSRKRGLLGRSSLLAGEAIVLAPCSAIHTFKMRFVIDLVYARRDGRVLKVRSGVRPNRISGAVGAFAVIELAAGTVERTRVKAGDQLEIRLPRP
jgi:uncharacterized protein